MRTAYVWVERVARVLANEDGASAAVVRRRFIGVLGALARYARRAHTHQAALQHFVKVTRSYWQGLFHTYEVAGVPRTNNALEQLFGSHRYHERRASGRRGAAPSLVVRGTVRLVAGTATRLRTVAGEALIPTDVARWRALRAQLEERRAVRVQGRRFRRDPDRYLRALEVELLKQTLPS